MTDEKMKKFAAEVEANEELKAKLRACKTQEEIAAVVRENNFELSLDDLDAAAGGERGAEPYNHCRRDSCAGYSCNCLWYY